MRFAETDGLVFKGGGYINKSTRISIRFSRDSNGFEVLSLSDDASGLMISVDYEDVAKVISEERSRNEQG